MDIQMEIAVLERNADHQPELIQLSAYGGVTRGCTLDITIGFFGDYAGAYSSKKACAMLDQFLTLHDRLIWETQYERDLFISFAKKYFTYQIGKNCIIATKESNNG